MLPVVCPQYNITEHGQVREEAKMIAEIYARGPIACTIAVTQAFENYHGGIFKDTTGAKVGLARWTTHLLLCWLLVTKNSLFLSSSSLFFLSLSLSLGSGSRDLGGGLGIG